MQVRISDVVEGMEFQFEDSTSFLNKKDGSIISIDAEEMEAAKDNEPIETFPDWQQDIIREAKIILTTDEYIALPTNFEIHEYVILKNFCKSIEDQRVKNIMSKTIKGKGAFSRFKELIYRFNIEMDWFVYREEALKKIAIDWCKKNNFDYIDDIEENKN